MKHVVAHPVLRIGVSFVNLTYPLIRTVSIFIALTENEA